MPDKKEKDTRDLLKNRNVTTAAIIGAFVVALILVIGTIWTGQKAQQSSEEAVRSVSLMYLEELAGRRQQVVASNLKTNIDNMHVAVNLLSDDDLADAEHLQSYQNRIRELYGLNKFAFIDEEGLVYTSKGVIDDRDYYSFDPESLTGPDISINDLDTEDKKVIIAIPVDDIHFDGHDFKTCFVEIEMSKLLDGISLQTDNNETTFCNIYTRDGIALTNMVLGGLAREDNLIEAMKVANFSEGESDASFAEAFMNGKQGVISFVYNDISETLYYEPIEGTDWMLTYLIRESVITEHIGSVSSGIIRRSLILTLLTVAVLVLLLIIMLLQARQAAKLSIEKERSEAESRVKQEELEEKLALQEKLLEQEKFRAQLDQMITALASDYKGVYYANLDTNEAVVVRANPELKEAYNEGYTFSYKERFKTYADNYVDASFYDGFLEFIEPEMVKKALEDENVISYRYLVHRNGKDSYEMLRMAGVRHAEDRLDHKVHAVGLGFSDVDRETRETMSRSQALSDALTAAEEASKAKTAFLSNMSHEIRTPMNAIIGLDAIALNDPDLKEETRDKLEKIGSSAQHLLSIINDILDMSRIESGRMTLKHEEFSMHNLLEQVNTMIGSQCNEKNINYICRVNGRLDDYYIGDDVKLRQVIINILGNAVKFTPEGGEIEFVVERSAHFGGKSTIRMTMMDTGIGISEDYLPKLFDAFSQEDSSSSNKYGSSGLGLAITKNIVEMMNGKIDVESVKGEGTTFTVSVTLEDSEHGVEEIEELRPQDMAVLIVDDDPVACEHARLILENAGIKSETTTTGKEAVEMVRLRHARRDLYDLILVDWKMPEMDGIETTKRIRSITGDESAIIILTAYRWDDVLEDAISAGVDCFLAKPLFAATVLEEFSKALRKKNLSADGSEERTELKGRKILMAEDVKVNAEIMIMILNMKEIEVDHAENGRIAVEMFESHPEGYYDAILMDMRMPEMDGLEATTRIRGMERRDSKTIPIIALTANAFDEDVQRSLQAGLNAHLTKPVEPEILFDTLERLIKD